MDVTVMNKAHICVLCLLLILSMAVCACSRDSQIPADPVDSAIDTERRKLTQPEPTTADSETEPAPVIYESPIDFAALQEANPHICAWLDIPGTDISYPVLLHDSDNSFYLSHAENRGSSSAGCLFMENYNQFDCSDPALAIYGHHMKNGIYFGNLQNLYETAEGFEAHRDIMLYLPDREIPFRVFAAVPYNNSHLLYTYDFGVSYEFDEFIQRVCEVRSFSAQRDPFDIPQFGQQLLILSTCLKGNSNMRYLVIGAAKEDSLI